MTFYEALEEAAAGIMDPENFGVTGLLKTSIADPGTTVTVTVHSPHNVPFQGLADRQIDKDGSMRAVHCRKKVKVIFSDKGQTSDFALLNLLVSEVPTVLPGYTVTVGTDVWEVI